MTNHEGDGLCHVVSGRAQCARLRTGFGASRPC